MSKMKRLVRWRIDGIYISEGLAYPREQGDEDMMTEGEFQTYSVCGMVEEIQAERQALIVVIDDEPDIFS